ncbi:MAG: flagellar motor protein MotB [Deltaproteobacteria bacterium]|nr:flagellar motor protein MotB [Deltaproteobacteria bacterium]
MRKKKEEEHASLERWLVSYADFITLMFAFFTVLYAISQTDKSKYQAVAESLQRAFMSAGGLFPLRGTPFTPFMKPPDKGSEIPPSFKDTGKQSKQENEAFDRMAYQMRELFEKTSGLSLRPGMVEVLKTPDGFKIRLDEAILYKAGSDKIKRDFVPFLYEISRKLGRLGLPIRIEGHSDNSPSPRTSNWQLSINRAYNLMQFMVQGCSFPQDRVSILAHGENQPIADNDTPEGRAKNRRVEIAVVTHNRDISSLPF